MKLVQFTLSMPHNNSWNRRWSSDDRFYAVVRNMTNKAAERVLAKSYYLHAFGDGWVAGIDVKQITAQEARQSRKKSAGFCGYDWMIDNIVWYGNASGEAHPRFAGGVR